MLSSDCLGALQLSNRNASMTWTPSFRISKTGSPPFGEVSSALYWSVAMQKCRVSNLQTEAEQQRAGPVKGWDHLASHMVKISHQSLDVKLLKTDLNDIGRFWWLSCRVKVRVGLAYLLAHRPEGHMWVIAPQIYGHNTPKIYLKPEDRQGLPNRKIVSIV